MSIIRDLEYQAVDTLTFSGTILDIGGSNKSGYHERMRGAEKIVSMNINPDYGCDIVADVEKPFPMETGTFDGAIALNVLEHIYQYQHVVNETFRVLKPGGRFVVATPFFFHVHGSPDDYFRYTKSSLQRIFTEAGFTRIQIDELGYQVFSAFHQTASGILVFRPLIRVMGVLCIGLDRLLSRLSKKYANIKLRIPLGYLTVAYKPEA